MTDTTPLTIEELEKYLLRFVEPVLSLARKTLSNELTDQDPEIAEAAINQYPRGELVPAWLVVIAGAGAETDWRELALIDLTRSVRRIPCENCRGRLIEWVWEQGKQVAQVCSVCLGTGVEP